MMQIAKWMKLAIEYRENSDQLQKIRSEVKVFLNQKNQE